MRRVFYAFGTLLFALVLFVFLGISNSDAQKYDTALPKIRSIPAPAFEMPDELASYTNNGVLFLNADAEYVRAPLVLPHKARLQKVEMVCKDNNAAGSIRMWLHVYSNDLSESFTLCLVESTGASDTYRTFSTTTISPNKIFNDNYNYFLNLRLPGTKADGYEFVAAKIHFKGGK